MIESLPDSFQHAMLQWFDRHGRHDLPWQQHKTHYRVWVSEIMLQHNQPLAILDGNVKQVLSRFGAIAGWPGDKKVADQLWQLDQTLTPTDRVADYIPAMMDLGSTLCTRTKPQCLLCPLQQSCQAFQQGDVTRYPGKKLKRAYPTKQA